MSKAGKFKRAMRKFDREVAKAERRNKAFGLKDGDKNWKDKCLNCGASPTVHPTNLCGPHCFGEAATINGNW